MATSDRLRPSTSVFRRRVRKSSGGVRVLPTVGYQGVHVHGEFRVSAGQPLTPLGAVEGGIGPLHHFIAPAPKPLPVLPGYADQMSDDVDRDGHDEVGDQVAVTTPDHRIEILVAQITDERLESHGLVVRHAGIDDLSHPAVARFNYLVDELLVVGNHDAGSAEAGHECVHLANGLEDLSLSRQVPPDRDASYGALLAHNPELLVRDVVPGFEGVEFNVDTNILRHYDAPFLLRALNLHSQCTGCSTPIPV